MKVLEKSMDDLLYQVYTRMLKSRSLNNVDSTKGRNIEHIGAHLILKNPLARLSRSMGKGHIFSALGEFIWYMSGSDCLHHIEHYLPGYDEFSDDGHTIYGAYGPRIMNGEGDSQFFRVLDLLKKKTAPEKQLSSFLMVKTYRHLIRIYLVHARYSSLFAKINCS